MDADERRAQLRLVATWFVDHDAPEIKVPTVVEYKQLCAQRVQTLAARMIATAVQRALARGSDDPVVTDDWANRGKLRNEILQQARQAGYRPSFYDGTIRLAV